MRLLSKVLMVVLLFAGVTATASAWEFSMRGEYEYRFRWFSRTGPNDLFGNASVQTGSWPIDFGPAGIWPVVNSVGLAGPNMYGRGAPFAPVAFGGPINAAGIPASQTTFGDTASSAGYLITRGGYARWSSDALQSDSRWTMRAVLRVNDAIRVHGVYNIGGYRHKYAQRAAVDLFSNQPIIALGVGARRAVPTAGVPPFENYYQSQTSMNAYDTAAIGSWEQFRATIVIPWGIISIGVKDFPIGTGISFGENVRGEGFVTIVPYGPFRLIHCIWLSRGVDSWATVPDSDFKCDLFQSPVFTYRNGPLEIFGGVLITCWHSPAQGPLGPNADFVYSLWGTGFKYNNGRFFCNGEYTWFNSDTTRIGALPTYGEAYHCMVEAGTIMGPAKLSFAWFQASGPVANNANPTKQYQPWPINWQAMEPYNWLMFDIYGGGNQTFNGIFVEDGQGMLGDGFAFTGRIDYAAASNLNCWVCYLWAHRLEEYGTLFGQYNSIGTITGPVNLTNFARDAGRAPTGSARAPYGYVTDGFIGWEVDAGVNWKLLEGMTARFKYAYWKPGDYFREAWQAVGISPVRGGPVADTVLQSRDAIHAFQGSLLIEF